MAKGRKSGCPVNIRNWLVYILDVASNEYIRIYGLSSLTRNIDSETEDGSADTETWSEPYVTKRSGSISLEGREVVVELTGENDPGQELLNSYAEVAGCDADATLKFVDPYGHAFIADYIVTSREISADDTGTTLTWDLEQVGEAEVLPYVQVTVVSFNDGDSAATSASLTVGGAPKIISVVFEPEEASNKRFKITNSKRSVVTISNITEDGFTLTPMAVGTATITVTTANGGKRATLEVTVSAGT